MPPELKEDSARQGESEHSKLRLLSFLLQFPDEKMILELSHAKQETAEIPADEDDAVAPLINYLIQTPLIDLQEHYSAVFDLNPAFCLNLTYHQWGDKKERGAAIARFAKIYADAGYGPTTGELPDFLPLVLEFLSVCDENVRAPIMAEYAGTVELLGRRLADAGTPYAGLFSVICGIFAL